MPTGSRASTHRQPRPHRALRTHLTKLDWAWSKKKKELAAAVLAEPIAVRRRATIRVGETAKRLVREVDAAIARVRERISKDPSRDWLTLAQDPEVREAVHEGTQILSGATATWRPSATIRGGGSRTRRPGTSSRPRRPVGHQASQALAAVHRHRRQLPDDLRLRIFGKAHF